MVQQTWKIYIAILFLFGCYVTSVVGYALTRFGTILKPPLALDQRDFWWWALSLFTTILVGVEVIKIAHFLFEATENPGSFWKYAKLAPKRVFFITLAKLKNISMPILSGLMLCPTLDNEVRRYISSVNVILSCFSFMISLSRLPRIGIYVFMLHKVFVTILNFFCSYFWHFLGYAIAFHVLLPDEGAFSSLGNSIIKVTLPQLFYKHNEIV